MQDRYVGDIGDFAKYGLLRAIRGGKRLGVAWYLHSDAGPAGDGRHTRYLDRPGEWRHLDCKLFDTLKKLVDENRRSVAAVKRSGLLGDADFAGEQLCIEKVPIKERTDWRRQRFENIKERLADCKLVFADPDNGLCPDEKFKFEQKVSAKRMPLHEATELAEGRTAILYHHNTRYKGGHCKEIQYWICELPGRVRAFYWRRWSCRTFFVVNPDSDTEERLECFAARWRAHGKLI